MPAIKYKGTWNSKEDVRQNGGHGKTKFPQRNTEREPMLTMGTRRAVGNVPLGVAT